MSRIKNLEKGKKLAWEVFKKQPTVNNYLGYKEIERLHSLELENEKQQDGFSM